MEEIARQAEQAQLLALERNQQLSMSNEDLLHPHMTKANSIENPSLQSTSKPTLAKSKTVLSKNSSLKASIAKSSKKK